MSPEEEALLAANPTGSLLPEHELHVEEAHRDTTSGETKKTFSPEQIAQQGRDAALLADQEAQEKTRLEEQARPTAQINSDLAAGAATNVAATQKAKLDALQGSNGVPGLDAMIQQHRDRIKATEDRLAATPTPALFADGTTHGSIIKGAMLGLATLGDAMQKAAMVRIGHAPPTVNTVGDIINRDLDRQRENIGRLKDNVVMARTGLNDAQQARTQMLQEIDLKGAAAYDKLLALSKARLAALGVKGVDIESNQHVLDLRDKAEEHRRKVTDTMFTEVAKHTTAHGAVTSTTDRTGKTNPNAVPKTITDNMSGQDLPIDPTRTDSRKHNAAVANLPNVNGAIQILDSVLGSTANGEQHAPEWAKYLGSTDAKAQAGLNGQMTRFRSAYAASKKESVGESNAHELASAIPDPPSFLAPRTAWEAWQTKIEDTRKEMLDMRKEHLANAGVPRAVIEQVSQPKEGNGGNANAAQSVTAPAPTQPPPFVPQAPAQVTTNAQPGTPKLRAIQLLKSNDPSIAAGRPLLMRKYGITEADLQ